MLPGSQPKSRTRLMGSPLLCDPSLENWSRHPDSCLPSSAYCDGAWHVDGGEMRGCGCFSHFWCLPVTGKALVDKTKATCVRAPRSDSPAVIHTRAPPSSDSSNGTLLICAVHILSEIALATG